MWGRFSLKVFDGDQIFMKTLLSQGDFLSHDWTTSTATRYGNPYYLHQLHELYNASETWIH